MTKINDGGPAFPTPPALMQMREDGTAASITYSGMSLRDWFAGQALAAVADTNPNLPDDPADGYWPDAATLASRRAAWAYVQADAMLAAREAEKGDKA